MRTIGGEIGVVLIPGEQNDRNALTRGTMQVDSSKYAFVAGYELTFHSRMRTAQDWGKERYRYWN